MNSSRIVLKIVKICARILVCVVLFASAVYVGRSSYDLGYRIYTEPAMDSVKNERRVSVQISREMSNRDVAKLMEENELCRSSDLFYIQLQLSEYKNGIKPGLYILSTSMNPNQIIDVLGGKSTEENEEK